MKCFFSVYVAFFAEHVSCVPTLFDPPPREYCVPKGGGHPHVNMFVANHTFCPRTQLALKQLFLYICT